MRRADSKADCHDDTKEEQRRGGSYKPASESGWPMGCVGQAEECPLSPRCFCCVQSSESCNKDSPWILLMDLGSHVTPRAWDEVELDPGVDGGGLMESDK